MQTLPSGWRLGRLPDQSISFGCGDDDCQISYRSLRDGSYLINECIPATIYEWTPNSISLEINNRRFKSKITFSDDLIIVKMPWGDCSLSIQPKFVLPGSEKVAGGLIAPMPGKVIELKVKVGSKVKKGDSLVILEAMKMEHQVSAPEDGKVKEVFVKKGEQLENGALLMVLD